MATTTQDVSRIVEYTRSDAVRVDRAASVIRGVKVLGFVSENGRTYDRAAVAKARGLYENLPVYLDHSDVPGRVRPVAERFGKLFNVAERDDGLYADLQYFKTHPTSATIAEAAEVMPDAFGLSHDAQGVLEVGGDGRPVVVEIRSVNSVDVVSRPATTRGLFESKEAMTMKVSIRSILERIYARPEQAAILREMDAAVSAAGDVELPNDASSEGQVSAAIESMVIAAVRDASLDTTAKLAKIRDILKAFDKLSGKQSSGGDGSESAAQESAANKPDPSLAALIERVERIAARADARDLIEARGRESTPERIAAVLAARDDAARVAIVESWPARGPGGYGRPARSARADDGGAGPKPVNVQEFVAAIR